PTDDGPITKVVAGVILLALLGFAAWGVMAGIRKASEEKPATADGSPPVEPAPVVGPQPAPPSTTVEADPLLESPDRPVYLADMAEFDVRMGPWKFGKGELGNGAGTPIRVGKVHAQKGLSVHPGDQSTTSVSYALGGKATTLVGAAALADDASDVR